jgi:hypothetical protein
MLPPLVLVTYSVATSALLPIAAESEKLLGETMSSPAGGGATSSPGRQVVFERTIDPSRKKRVALMIYGRHCGGEPTGHRHCVW